MNIFIKKIYAVGLLGLFACKYEQPQKRPVGAVEIVIEKVKLVHAHNPTLSVFFKDSVENFPKALPVISPPTRKGVYFQLKFRNFTDTTFVLHADSFQRCFADQECVEVYGLNEQGYPFTNTHLKISLNAGDSLEKQLLIASYRSNAFESWGETLGVLMGKAHSFQSKESFLVYNFSNHPKRVINFSENTPVEVWYSFDFRTFEAAKKYGQPFFALPNDSTRQDSWFDMLD